MLCVLSRFSRVQLFATLWTAVPLSMGFSRREYWSGLPCHPPGDLSNSGIKPRSPALLLLLLLLLLSCFSRVRLCATPYTAAHQAPVFLGFSRQEYWSGLPFPSPEDLPNPETEPISPALAGGFFTTESPGRPSQLTILVDK